MAVMEHGELRMIGPSGLQRARQLAGLTQGRLARLLGVDAVRVHKYENDHDWQKLTEVEANRGGVLCYVAAVEKTEEIRKILVKSGIPCSAGDRDVDASERRVMLEQNGYER